MRKIRAGALRTPVHLGRPVIVKDAAGGESITWNEFATWAFIESLTGREWATGVAVKDVVDCRITIRITPGWEPSARWRVRETESGRLYNIVTAMLLGKEAAAECLAKTAPGNSDAR